MKNKKKFIGSCLMLILFVVFIFIETAPVQAGVTIEDCKKALKACQIDAILVLLTAGPQAGFIYSQACNAGTVFCIQFCIG
jgi:hypothetical protein